MRAMVYQRYGSTDNLEMREVEKPVAGDNDVLVKVRAASLNWLDWHFLTGTPFLARLMAGGFLKPKNNVLGIDLAGTVESVGSNAKHFQPGDEVFGGSSSGAFADYSVAGQEELQPKPDNVTFEEAAAAGAAAFVALQGLRDAGQIKSGQRVLINGASGGVGTFAVQLARAFGAETTGVCSTRNLDLVRSIGADQVIDYTQKDFTRNGQQYDLIFDAVAKRSYSDCRRALTAEAIFVTTEFSPILALRGLLTSMGGGTRLVPLQPKPPNEEDRALIKELLAEGKVASVVDRQYPLDELPAAFRHLEQGHARGKIVLTMT